MGVININMISIIAVIAKNRAIGYQNKLLYNIPDDMEHFRNITTGHTVIMGQKTYESIGRPLPKRVNIVISNDPNFTANGCLVVHSIDEAVNLAKEKEKQEIFIIGGGMIYKQFMPLADKLYLTIVDDEPIEADTFFPNYTQSTKVIKQEDHEYQGLKFKFVELIKHE